MIFHLGMWFNHKTIVNHPLSIVNYQFTAVVKKNCAYLIVLVLEYSLQVSCVSQCYGF